MANFRLVLCAPLGCSCGNHAYKLMECFGIWMSSGLNAAGANKSPSRRSGAKFNF